MDSLILVLIVVGAVMVLAGFARMKGRRRDTWDDIDHSVLFSKDDDQAALAAKTEPDEPRIDANMDRLSAIVDDEAVEGGQGRTSGINADEGDAKKSSLLDKIKQGIHKLDEGTDEAEPEIGPVRLYKADAPDLVLVLNITAPEGRHFNGSALAQAIEGAGMCFGEMDIYHYRMNDAIAFSLANMVKPGTFDQDQIDSMSTPGISLFVQLPIVRADGMDIFNTMLEVTHALSQRLGGELRDETRSVLTHSVIDGIRERIINYNAKWRVVERADVG